MLISCFPFFLHGKERASCTVDVTRFPQIRLELSEYNTDASFYKVKENGKELDFTLLPNDKKRMVFFLFESSEVTHRKPGKLIEEIVEEITSLSSDLYQNAEFAYGYYNRSSKNNKALHLLSDSYTSFDSIPINDIRGISSQTRVVSKWTDMLKATYECIDWIGLKRDSFASKQLIIIGTGKSLSESPIKHKECIERAKQMGIQIQTIGLPSEDRYAFDNFTLLVQKDTARSVLAMNRNEVKAAIRKYLSVNNVNIIEYTSDYPTDGKLHTTEVSVGSKTITINFRAPMNESFLNKYLYLLIGLIILFILSIVFFIIRRRKKIQIQQKDCDINTPITSSDQSVTEAKIEIQQPTRSRTQITVRPTSLTIQNGGKTETIGIIEGVSSFGRDTNNNIIIQNDTVSGKHFMLEYNGIDCIITNLSKTNGTLVNGIRQIKAVVYSGDVLKIGEVSINLN